MDLEIGQILTQILAFLIMLWILKRFAWKPLLGVLEERRQTIKAAFKDVEDRKKDVQDLIGVYNAKIQEVEAQAREKIQKAIQEGRQISQDIQAQAQEQAKAILSKTQFEIEKEIAKAKVELKHRVVDMTIAATQKLIQEHVDEKKQKELINEFVNQADFK